MISGLKPRRIELHSHIGSVLRVPVTRSVISVSSKESAKVRIAEERNADIRFGASTKRKVCQRLAPRSSEASIRLGLSACSRVSTIW